MYKMRSLVYMLIFLPGFLYSQTAQEVPKTFGQPAPKETTWILKRYYWHSQPFVRFSSRDSVVKQLEQTSDKLKNIDFDQYDLVFKSFCSQCLLSCPDPGDPCHRNACRYQTHWFLEPKRELVEFSIVPGMADKVNFFKEFYMIDSQAKADSLNLPELEDINFSTHMVLGRTVFGDCLAQFWSEVTSSADKKTLYWTLHEEYGGCRAGQVRKFWIIVPKPSHKVEIVPELVRHERKW